MLCLILDSKISKADASITQLLKNTNALCLSGSLYKLETGTNAVVIVRALPQGNSVLEFRKTEIRSNRKYLEEKLRIIPDKKVRECISSQFPALREYFFRGQIQIPLPPLEERGASDKHRQRQSVFYAPDHSITAHAMKAIELHGYIQRVDGTYQTPLREHEENNFIGEITAVFSIKCDGYLILLTKTEYRQAYHSMEGLLNIYYLQDLQDIGQKSPILIAKEGFTGNGSWGKLGNVTPFMLKDATPAVLIEGGGTWQGCSVRSIIMVSMLAQGPKVMINAAPSYYENSTGYDNDLPYDGYRASIMSPPPADTDFAMRYSFKNSDVPDLIVTWRMKGGRLKTDDDISILGGC